MIIRKYIFAITLLWLATASNLAIAEDTSQQLLQTNKGVSEMFFSGKNKSSEPATVSALVGKSSENQPSLSDLFAQVFKGLLYCVATILLGASLYRRFFEKPAAKADDLIKVLGKRTIAPKTALIIIESAGQKFLLSHTPDQVALLAELNSAPHFDDTLISLYEQESVSVNSK